MAMTQTPEAKQATADNAKAIAARAKLGAAPASKSTKKVAPASKAPTAKKAAPAKSTTPVVEVPKGRAGRKGVTDAEAVEVLKRIIAKHPGITQSAIGQITMRSEADGGIDDGYSISTARRCRLLVEHLGYDLDAPRASTRTPGEKKAKANSKLEHLEALKAEHKALEAWKAAGAKGSKPETPVTDKADAERLAAEQERKARANKTAEQLRANVAKAGTKAATVKQSAAKKQVTPLPKTTRLLAKKAAAAAEQQSAAS